jgi:hypothetical protein
MTLAGVTLAVCSARAQEDWTKRFRIGATAAFNISADFSTSGTFDVGGNGPGPVGVPGQNHFYDDGYVRVDNTGNAGGYTTYWGYDDPSQYDPRANTLTYQSTTSFDQSQNTGTIDDAPYFGFDMAYGTTLTEIWGGALGWELGFTLLPINITGSDSSPTTGSRTVHQFSTGGLIMPQAPYNGSAVGTGPAIQDIATGLTTEESTGTLYGSRDLDSMLYNIRLGANARWDLGGRWSMSAGLGFATGIVTSDYTYKETIVYDLGGGTSNYSGSYRSTDYVFGGYGELMVYCQVEKSGELYLGGQYMGMTSVHMSDQGRDAELNLNGGIFITAGIHWAF